MDYWQVSRELYSSAVCCKHIFSKSLICLGKYTSIFNIFKGTKTDLRSKLYFSLSFSIFSLVIWYFNVLSKFENQILNYKQHTEFQILCFVNKTRVLLLFTFVLYWYKFKSDVASSVDDIICGPIESVYKVFLQDI